MGEPLRDKRPERAREPRLLRLSDTIADRVEAPKERAAERMARLEDLSPTELHYAILRNATERLLPQLSGASPPMGKELKDLLAAENDPEKRKKLERVLLATDMKEAREALQDLEKAYKDNPAALKSISIASGDLSQRSQTRDLALSLLRDQSSAAILRELPQSGADRTAGLERLLRSMEDGEPEHKRVVERALATALLDQALADPKSRKGNLTQLLSLLPQDSADRKALQDVLNGNPATADLELRELRTRLAPQPGDLNALAKALDKKVYDEVHDLYPAVRALLIAGITRDALDLARDRMLAAKDASPVKDKLWEGCPIEIPQDVLKSGAAFDAWLNRLSSGELKLDLPERMEDLLINEESAVRLGQSAEWYTLAERTAFTQDRLNDALSLDDRLRNTFHAPEGWSMPEDADIAGLNRWLDGATEMNGLLTRVRNYAQAYLDLENIAPGINSAEKSTSAIAALREMGVKIQWDQNRKITVFDVPLGPNLNFDLPENDQPRKQLYDWLQKHHQTIDDACDTFQAGPTIRYGAFDEGGTVVSDATGKQLRVEDRQGNVTAIWHDGEFVQRNASGDFVTHSGKQVQDVPKSADEQRYDFDYVRDYFESHTVGDQIKIDTMRLFCKDNWANFGHFMGDWELNKARPDVPVARDSFTVSEDKLVRVQNSDTRPDLLRAEDTLDGFNSWRSWQMIDKYAVKGGEGLLNVGLIFSGTGAAAKGLLTLKGALGAGRVLLGASGLLEGAVRMGDMDNALKALGWSREDYHKYRSMALLADMPFEFGAGAMSVLGAAEKGATRFQRIMNILENSGHAMASFGGTVATPSMARQIGVDIERVVHGSASRNVPLAEAHRGLPESLLSQVAFRYDPRTPEGRRQLEQRSFRARDEVVQTLPADSPVGERVRELYQRTQEVADLDPADPKRREEIARLTALLNPTGAEILLARIRENPRSYTDDPSGVRRPEFESNQEFARRAVESEREPITAEECLAAAACLIRLSGWDGKAPDTVLGETARTIPEHYLYDPGADPLNPHSIECYRKVPAETSTVQVTGADLARLLEAQTERSPGDAAREIANIARREPTDPVADIRNIGVREHGVDEAARYLQRSIPLTDDQAHKLALNVIARVDDAEAEVRGLYAQHSAANRLLRAELGLSVQDAESLVAPLRAGHEPSRSPDESARKTELRDASLSRLETEFHARVKADHLVAADLLWRMDGRDGKPALSDRQLAAICLDNLNNRKLPTDLRMDSLLNANSPRLGELLQQISAEEKRDSSLLERHVRSADVTSQLTSILSADGTVHGVKEPSDLRAASALVLFASRMDDPNAARSLLHDAATKYAECKTRSGSLAQFVVDTLGNRIDNFNRQGANADYQSRREAMAAAAILKSIGEVDLPGGAFRFTDSAYNDTLLRAASSNNGGRWDLRLDPDHPELMLGALSSLHYESLNEEQRDCVLRVLSLPTQGNLSPNPAAVQSAQSIVCQNLAQMLGASGVTDGERTRAFQSIVELFDANSPTSAGRNDDLRAAAMMAVRDVGWSDPKAIQLLESRLQPVDDTDHPGKRRPADYSADVRRVAFEALMRLKQPLNPSVLEYLDLENDPSARRSAELLRERERLERRAKPEATAEEFERTTRDVLENAKLQPSAGSGYVDRNFPLLQAENYKRSLTEALQRQSSSQYAVTVKPDGSVDWVRSRSRWASWWESSTLGSDEEAAVKGVMRRYEETVDQLCDAALRPRGTPEEARRNQELAINGIAHILKTNCASCPDGFKDFVRDKLTHTLVELCGRTAPGDGGTVASPARVLAWTAVKDLLEFSSGSPLNPDTALSLLPAVRRMQSSVGTAECAGLTAQAMKHTLSCVEWKGEDAEKHKQLQMALVEDLYRYRALGAVTLPDGSRLDSIEAILRTAETQSEYEDVRKAALFARDRLTRGIFAIRQDVLQHPDSGTTPSQRAESLANEIEKRKAGAADETALVHRIFRSTEGCPITDESDPRLNCLYALCHDPSARVRLAAGVALMDQALAVPSAVSAGLAVARDVADHDHDGLQQEARHFAVMFVREFGDNRDLWNRLKDYHMRCVANGPLERAWRAEDGIHSDVEHQTDVLMEELFKTPEARYRDHIAELSAAWDASGLQLGKADGLSIPELVDRDNSNRKDLLSITENLCQDTKVDPSMRVVASYYLMRCEFTPPAVRAQAKEVLEQLTHSSDPTVRADATRALDTRTVEQSRESFLELRRDLQFRQQHRDVYQRLSRIRSQLSSIDNQLDQRESAASGSAN